MTNNLTWLSLAALVAGWSCTANSPRRGGELERRLVSAVDKSDVASATQLLQSGADPNKLAPFGDHLESAWRLALNSVRPEKRALIEIMEAMVAAHADPLVAWGESPPFTGPKKYTVQRTFPLLTAVSADVPEVVRALMKTGMDRRYGRRPLVLAVENGQAEIVHILVEAGVDVNYDPGPSTPLVAAIHARNAALMTYLEEHGARENPSR